jgi:hypothetical protein
MVLAVWRLSPEQQLAKDVLEWRMPATAVPVAKAALVLANVGSVKKLAAKSAKSAAVASELARGAWC